MGGAKMGEFLNLQLTNLKEGQFFLILKVILLIFRYICGRKYN